MIPRGARVGRDRQCVRIITSAWADKLGLGGLSAWADAASAALPKGRVATQTCPRKQFPMFAPLRSTLAAPDRLTLEQTNQTNSPSRLFYRVFFLETLHAGHSCTVLLDLSGVFILHPACTNRLSRALGHTYTGRPHLFPTHLPDHPSCLQSFYTVLFKIPKHASY